MRNGVLGVFAEIVIKVLSTENLDENMKKSRESFLDKLEVRSIHCGVSCCNISISYKVNIKNYL